jgi:hypothetical protein
MHSVAEIHHVCPDAEDLILCLVNSVQFINCIYSKLVGKDYCTCSLQVGWSIIIYKGVPKSFQTELIMK